MNIIEKNIDEIKEYENNPRHNEKAVESVAASIKEFGFKVPIVIDSENIIVAGHTRLKASKLLGFVKVPCVVADDLTPEKLKAFRLADNKTGELAEWDFNALAKEFSEIENLDMLQFGFEMEEISGDDFDEDFSLSDAEKGDYQQITFTLHNEQMELINYALEQVDECKETFGNTNKKANAIYEVVRQWAEQRK